MTVFSGQTAKAGHFVQPTATAMGHRVMSILPERPYSHPITAATMEAPPGREQLAAKPVACVRLLSVQSEARRQDGAPGRGRPRPSRGRGSTGTQAASR